MESQGRDDSARFVVDTLSTGSSSLPSRRWARITGIAGSVRAECTEEHQAVNAALALYRMRMRWELVNRLRPLAEQPISSSLLMRPSSPDQD